MSTVRVDAINFFRVSAGGFACFRVGSSSVYAAQCAFCSGFDFRQLHLKRAAELRPFTLDGHRIFTTTLPFARPFST